jgi:uncharacterized membrane protein YkgB
MKRPSKIQLSLLLMRLSIFVVMLMWTIDKFINPHHSAKVFEKFYYIPNSHLEQRKTKEALAV